MNTNDNLEMTICAISVSWRSAQDFEAKGNFEMARWCWDKMQSKIDGMWSMANWVVDCDDTMELLVELRDIARIHERRIRNY